MEPAGIDREALEAYLSASLGARIIVKEIHEIGSPGEQSMKEFGYGRSLNIVFEEDGRTREAVISTMKGDRYGHQFYWDRAATLMFEYESGARLEKHVRPLGIGYISRRGRLVPLEDPREFFILNEKIEGHPYSESLERISREGLRSNDRELVRAFTRWLAGVHAVKRDDPDLYLRRVRQLMGDSECIWGIIDGYPYPCEFFPPERFREVERRLVEWRWKLRDHTRRLAVVHGDFHPWNVMIRPDGDFTVLDRSRGEWGEPADDVASMTGNYILFALYREGGFGGDFAVMYREFWDSYLEETGDEEMLEVIPPFYVFRALVMASPEWYPNQPAPVRRQLFNFAERVLAEARFDYRGVDRYLE